MSGLPLEKNNIAYADFLEQSVHYIEKLIEKEYHNSQYFEKLLSLIADKDCSNIISNFSSTAKKHGKILEDIYAEITNKVYIYNCRPIYVSNNFQKDLIWAILDRFQTVKLYNSLLENLTESGHKSLVLQIIQEERANISDLNSLLINK